MVDSYMDCVERACLRVCPLMNLLTNNIPRIIGFKLSFVASFSILPFIAPYLCTGTVVSFH